MKILVRRQGAFGDVLETTPILRRLRQQNPDALIHIETDYPQVFEANRDVDAPANGQTRYDHVIDLNMAFENALRALHPIDAYSEVAFGDRDTPHNLHFAWQRVEIQNAARPIVIHAARSWAIRTLPVTFWQKLIDLLREAGFDVLLTGTQQDHAGLTNCVDARNAPPAIQAGLIDAAECFICSESGPMILAQVTRTPIVALCTMIDPDHVTHNRYGEKGWRFHPVGADVPCIGCALRQPAAVTYFDCIEGHRRCISSFDPEMVARIAMGVAVARG